MSAAERHLAFYYTYQKHHTSLFLQNFSIVHLYNLVYGIYDINDNNLSRLGSSILYRIVETLRMKKTIRIFIYITFIIYCLLVLDLVLLSRVHMFRMEVWREMWLELWEHRTRLNYGLNLVPFRTINTYINSIMHGDIVAIAVRNLFGNLLMFLPLGIYLPIIWAKCRKLTTTLQISLVVLIGIELIQFITLLGSLDIDDLILNLCGILIGYGLWKGLKFIRHFNL